MADELDELLEEALILGELLLEDWLELDLTDSSAAFFELE
ncbi:hypothetical protein LCO01nite_04810 [Lapidilactobacillus concavus]|nr:hypothetical protein LCO01nite_04810 [Lapidilactobacillus concavus]